MQSRGIGSVLRLVAHLAGLALAALVVLGLTTVLAAGVVGWWSGVPVFGPAALYIGIVCSLASWLIVAAFHIHKETLVVPIHDRRHFADWLSKQMESLGYEVAVHGDDRLVGRPAFRSLLFGGSMQVELSEDSARILGPKVYLEMLRRRQRVEHHLEKTQQSYLDHRRRAGEQLLRRVQVCLQVSENQWQDVHDQILSCLAREGAVVHCHVNILAQSEQGMRDSIIVLGVEDWLRKNDIKAEVHKEALNAGKSAPPRLLPTAEPPLESIAPMAGGTSAVVSS